MKTQFNRGVYLFLLPTLASPLAAIAATDVSARDLEQRIRILEEKLETSKKGGVTASTNGRSLTFNGDDFSFQVGGRLQLDAAAYDAEQDGNEFGNGTRVRRLFLDVRGSVYEHWNYRFQYDFARPGGSDTSARGIRDAWIQYTGFSPAITVGQFKEPFGLEHLASSLHTTFIERGLTNAFTPDRRIGIGLSDNGQHWTYAVGAFGETAEGDVASEGNEGWDITGRVTYTPVNGDGKVVHLGLAGRQHTPEDSTNSLRFRERPESNVTDVRLIDTSTLNDVEDIQFLGLEAAAVFGPLSLQGERVDTQVSRDSGADDLDLSAWYAYASLFLTGESRPYKNGVFDRIKPKSTVGKGGIGAWEVALRYSEADLTDGSVIGGEEENLTLGVNWYATQNIRFAANYIKVLELDRPGSQYDDEKLDSVVLRAQIDF
ncbi:porin [Iodidimonas muriae]|uniref:Porin n=1 Tax=Iodidimonas muriae TaxID=261467 RepID=A0ABQ2LGK1_9PROT|nr:OprO/OprP family phosphate-selective porin [Iodidimonas muriae]GER08753.1 porin [Kordiimonadales bacterium JCM 17843]GGO17471.1 porin [Iodidimonas muriae]